MVSTVTIERLPVRISAGFDCIYDHANCPACAATGERNHGIDGGTAWYAVAAIDGTDRSVLVLEVLLRKYPASIPPSHWRGLRGPRELTPLGSALTLHRSGGNRPCDWIDGGCAFDVLGFSCATALYLELGNPDPTADPEAQSEQFWSRLERELARAIGFKSGAEETA